MTRRKAIAATSLITAVTLVLLTGAAAQAQQATPTPSATRFAALPDTKPLYGQLTNGDWVMVRGDQLFFVGPGGARSLCPDGEYPLKNGFRLPVLAAHIVPPWVKQGFNPQPEPPGKELRARTADGQHVVISGGQLYFEFGSGPRTRCPDGEYRLLGGGAVRVIGGNIQNPAKLQGFAP
ncbi:MAG: hypothetical protein ABR961_06875 [Thermoanaerobaculaceae bacterium]|jgi:hypothetical protein